MGNYNTVRIDHICEKCNHKYLLNIQFKYGELWLYEYRVGDVIKWGKINIGKPGCKRVVVDGAGFDCPVCGFPEEYYLVWLENDRIVDVTPSKGEFDFVHNENTYFVLVE